MRRRFWTRSKSLSGCSVCKNRTLWSAYRNRSKVFIGPNGSMGTIKSNGSFLRTFLKEGAACDGGSIRRAAAAAWLEAAAAPEAASASALEEDAASMAPLRGYPMAVFRAPSATGLGWLHQSRSMNDCCFPKEVDSDPLTPSDTSNARLHS